MSKVFAAVKALIEDKGRILVLEQEFQGRRFFDLPGGKVEHGESPYDTLYREVKEEVSLDIEIVRPIGMWWFFRESDNAQVICNTFLCRPKNAGLIRIPANEKIIRYFWLEKKKILELKLPHESLKKVFEMI